MGEPEPGLLWHAFQYEVNKTTASLMYLLQGMESVRSNELPHYNSLPPVQQRYAACFPKLSYVDVPMSVSGASYDPNHVLGREGEVERLAYKGWVEQLYFLWESRFRNELRRPLGGSDAIRPETDAFGDFRRIRNDLIHNNGIASEEHSGKCIVLKWFKPGEQTVLGMRHVFDFLNQIGFLNKPGGLLGDGSLANWRFFPHMEGAMAGRPAPWIVSIRTSMSHAREDGSSVHVVSVVFENGVFVNVPVDYEPDGRTLRERIDFIDRTFIDSDGNVRFANGDTKDRAILYTEAVAAQFGKGPKIEGVDIYGPLIRFKRRQPPDDPE